MTPSDLYSRILPHVPNCPTPLVDQAVMDTAIDFASETQIDFNIEAPIALANGQDSYSITEATGMKVDQVRHVYGPLWELEPVTPSQLQDRLQDWQTNQASDPRFYRTWPDANTIVVYPTPQNVTTQTLRVIAAWKPARTATAFPDKLGEDHFDALVAGALSRLMLVPERKWTNPQMAGVHAGAYNTARVNARIEAIHAKTVGTIRVRPRQFGS